MKNFKITLMLALALVFSLSFVGCEKKDEVKADDKKAVENKETEKKDDAKTDEKDAKKEEEKAPTPAENAGFTELPIGDEKDFEPYIHVKGVYFQPVDMYPESLGLSKDKANMHIEADISALEGNGFGFGAGDWIPYLQVDCVITEKETGNVAYEGTFMPMSASDGPHYGNNINLEKAGTYIVKFIIKDPSHNGYILHVDKTTGVERHEWWPEPIVAEWELNYTPNPEW